jgi:hypothetical protein
MTIEKELIVSDEFINIYKNFNVIDQIENMKKLSRKELFLLLIFSLDKHSDEDPVVIHNLLPFKEECMLIFDLQDDKGVDNEYIKELVELTHDEYISTDILRDANGNKLPEPLTKEEVRDAKINIINN